MVAVRRYWLASPALLQAANVVCWGDASRTLLISSIARGAHTARQPINERLVAADAFHIQSAAAAEAGAHTAFRTGWQALELRAGEGGHKGEGGEGKFVHRRVARERIAAG